MTIDGAATCVTIDLCERVRKWWMSVALAHTNDDLHTHTHALPIWH